MFDVTGLGQVFTPEGIVSLMLALRRRDGRVLEPSCGDGAFFHVLQRERKRVVGIELDARYCPHGALNLDFFDYPEAERFDTVIGNPPYVRFQDISPDTRSKLLSPCFDARSNLYLFFIEKCLRHLAPGGELIFITPRDFLKATSATRLNRMLFELGTITDAIELGDRRVFADAVPNCLIWRFERDCFDRTVRYAEMGTMGRLVSCQADLDWQSRRLEEKAGHLMFVQRDYTLRLADIAFVKVGAVSGADAVYGDPALEGSRKAFVNSATVSSGRTEAMLWPEADCYPPSLLPYKSQLLNRKVARFDESNWWRWGRLHYRSDRGRVYVNNRTRVNKPFFVHACKDYTGAVLGIFPLRTDIEVADLCQTLNTVDWADLGFVCDGRFIFSQHSLEQAPLPAVFDRFLPD